MRSATIITRHQRRARRLQSLTAGRGAHRAALQTGLGYRVSGESGALVVHTHSLSWHRAKTPNITVPPAGRGWDRSSRVRVVGVDQANAPKQGIQHQRDKQVAETSTVETTE